MFMFQAQKKIMIQRQKTNGFLTSKNSEFIWVNFNDKYYDKRMHRQLLNLRTTEFDSA